MAKKKSNKLIGIVGVVLIAIVVAATFGYFGGNQSLPGMGTGIAAQVFEPAFELPNVSNVDPNVSLSSFYCGSAADCQVIHTTSCFNNNANQQACIGSSAAQNYSAAYQNYLESHGSICAQYLVEANVSCACIHNGCSLTYLSR